MAKRFRFRWEMDRTAKASPVRRGVIERSEDDGEVERGTTMALDAATLALTARELKAALTEAKIAKIFEPTRDELVLTL